MRIGFFLHNRRSLIKNALGHTVPAPEGKANPQLVEYRDTHDRTSCSSVLFFSSNILFQKVISVDLLWDVGKVT
jgi:hypothetical protein